MSSDNPLWGAPRIHGELLKLGLDIGETSVGKYMVRRRNPPSQTFLENNLQSTESIDFLTVPTALQAPHFQHRPIFAEVDNPGI